MIRLLIAAPLLFAVPLSAQGSSAAATEAASSDTVAMQLANRLASDAIVLGQTRRALHRQLPLALKDNADMQEMEKAWPGIIAEFIAMMEPIIVDTLSRQMPAYRRDVAAIFKRHMQPEELVATDAFYASPLGQRIIALMVDGLDYTGLMKRQIATEGDAPVSGAELRAMITPAVQPAISALSTEDQMRLMQFGLTTAGRKMNRINPELLELSARFNNAKDPVAEAAIERATAALIERRMATKSTK